ncbi:MAG TPA: hypothetical protein VMU03_17735, partial [Gammaproteobacteria bacterium]|nr:hypothetical protein [Gammaproteobacteria bacterium]
MSRLTSGSCLSFLIASALVAPSALAQSATQLGPGLQNFVDCKNQTTGHSEHLMADRIEAKLAVSPALTPEMRGIWQAEIKALRAVTPKSTYVPPDPKNPQRYFLGLTDKEQEAINSMHSRVTQEKNLECEKKYGGMSRYSPGADQSAQKQYEKDLAANMTTPIDIATIPVTALPSPYPKTLEEQHAERRAQQQARMAQQHAAGAAANQAAVAKVTGCQQKLRGLRLTIMADHMQHNLDAASGLSAKDKADYQADIKSVRDAAAAGQQMPAPVDPANPTRAMTRLTLQDQMSMATEFGT